MKQALFIPVLCFFAFMAPTFPVLARPGGCVKGAIVGGIVGHFVGHGGVGAAAGCAYGVHGVIAMIAKIMRMKDDPVTHSPEDIAAMQARAVING
jgi:hypothetical protein